MIAMVEGKRMGAKDFFICGDLNVELNLENGDKRIEGLDSLDWNGLYGPESRGGGEDVVTFETLRWFQLLRDFDRVMSTWASSNAPRRSSHTPRMGFARQEKTN